ncbi:MAG: hypothetical protein DCF15_17600 [Phormidesmis priestleyi]|uniref:Uncharacterized protein n=1 Tax=Phormidesmis priestleyi TaxID=268141 RepID=A0A2W4YNY9_9CYAN|nr:MAG: hypothetical protein DCF15_17600 [Phormidesmis priestleyi]
MAIYPFCNLFCRPAYRAIRTATLANTSWILTSSAILSSALLTTGCSQLYQVRAGEIPADSSAPAVSNAQAAAPAAPTASNGVSTNYDIYHSKTLEVPAGTSVPAISVRVEPDPVQGWNLYVGTANFTFTPENVNGESSPTEGHGQLYINEKPMQRIYGTWTHLLDLPAGKNTLRVTLNANGFETLTTQGKPVEETTTIEVYKPAPPAPPAPLN